MKVALTVTGLDGDRRVTNGDKVIIVLGGLWLGSLPWILRFVPLLVD